MATRKSELIITCNAKGVQNVMNFLTERLKGIKQQLQALNNYGAKNGWTEDMKKDFKELTDEAAGIDTIMKRNQQTMIKYGMVMRDLSGSKLKDLKSALREATQSLNKMSEKSPGRQKLIDDIKKIKDQIAGTSGLTMSFSQAQKQLKNLDNTSMDKLKQGLASIKSQLDNPNIGNKWRRSLEQMQQQYQAAIATRQAPLGTQPVYAMSSQQLQAERTAMASAVAATSGVKGYEQKSAQYVARLKEIDNQLKLISQSEKKAEENAKQLQATQQAAKTVSQVYRGEAVSLEELNKAYATLEARAKQFAGVNPAKAKAAQQQMLNLKKRIDAVTASMQAEINIDRKFLKTATNSQLQEALTRLQQKLQSLNSTQGATAAKLKSDMKAIERQIKNNTGAIQQQGNTFGTAIKNITAYVGVFGAFNMIKSKVMSVYQSNLKLSDSLADIRKVSGLTSQEIDKLYYNISRIDSRNTIETLNKLAYTGAKLGIGQNYGVEGLTGFVRAAEQVQMALGEDLGEEALPALAKLTEVMNLIPRYGVEEAMQKSASAIFQLGATSTATGKNIVEFSKRLMGLANVSRISADELLAIGSAADAMGLMPEVAATAFNKLFTSLQKGHNIIEKTLGLAKGSINDNFAKGQTMKSIVDIFEAMNKRGNMNALDGIFKDLGSDGARLVAVMTTMADRVDILKKHLETSRDAFKSGTAVINEYMIQNETANALMERASNLWAKAFTNPEGVDMVKQLAEQWYEVSKSLTQSESAMYAFHNSIDQITNTVMALIKALPFLIKMLTWMGVFGGIRMLVNSFMALITAIRAATTATATLQVVMNSNWVLAGLSAVVAGISLYVESMNAAAEAAERAQKRQAELDEQLIKSKEKIDLVAAPLESYKKALDGSNKSLEERNKLMKDLLTKDYQEYLDYLGIEIDGAIDLAKAYAQVVKVLKQKKAYEEREQYRDEVNQTNKVDRMRSGLQFTQTAKSIGANNIDAEWLRQRRNLPVEDILASVVKAAGGSANSVDLKGQKANVYYDKDGNLMDSKALDRLRKNIREYSKARNTEVKLNKEVDDLYKDAVGDFNMDKFQEEALKGQLKRKGQLENMKVDKEELKKQRKEETERKQALRKELQDAQRDSDAIISKIEEWYRLQETVITGFAADGKWTQKQADVMIDQLNIAKNQALAYARRGISGRDEKSWEVYKKNIGDLMFDTSDMSKHLLEDILKVRLENVRTALGNIDKAGEEGISSTAMRDRLNKNAAGNIREVERIQKKTANEVEKMLKEYDYLTKAIDAFDNRLTQLGLLSESARAAAKRIQDAVNANPVESLKPGYQAPMTEEEVQQQRRRGIESAASKFIQNGVDSMTVNYEDHNALADWLRSITDVDVVMGDKGMEFKFAEWAEPFKEDFDRWLRDSKGYKAEMQAFYLSLVQMSDDYYDAVKKSADREKDLQEKRFRSAGYRDEEDRTDKNLELQGKMQSITGAGQNILQQNGLQDAIAIDPEVQRIQNHIFWRNKEYEDAKAHLDQMIALQEEEMQKMKDRNASEKEMEDMRIKQTQERAGLEEFVRQRETSLLEAAVNLAEKVSSEISERVSKVQQLSEPLNQWGEEVGEMLGEQWQGISREGKLSFGDMARNMGIEYAKLTLKMASENLMKKLQQGLFYKQMEMQAQIHQATLNTIESTGQTTRLAIQATGNAMTNTQQSIQDQVRVQKEAQIASIMAMFGISEGAAKTIAALGFWGIPLIGVITSVLMGLLSSAMATASTETSTASTKKVKLTSGMLTYDEGNVQTVVGDDGHVYRARSQKSLPEGVGIVKSPIATTVNGQQALVGERGPEIVIGRKTTRALMLNRPDILQALNTVDRGITTRRVRTFDEGNISDLASVFAAAQGDRAAVQSDNSTSDQSPSAAERDAMLVQTMQQMLPLMQGMVHLLENPVAPEIAMYGENGLHKKMKKADQFYARYGD